MQVAIDKSMACWDFEIQGIDLLLHHLSQTQRADGLQ
jgi:hypothetical protein